MTNSALTRPCRIIWQSTEMSWTRSCSSPIPPLMDDGNTWLSISSWISAPTCGLKWPSLMSLATAFVLVEQWSSSWLVCHLRLSLLRGAGPHSPFSYTGDGWKKSYPWVLRRLTRGPTLMCWQRFSRNFALIISFLQISLLFMTVLLNFRFSFFAVCHRYITFALFLWSLYCFSGCL